MAKKITIAQLERAFSTAPALIKREGLVFLTRGMSEYKRETMQTPAWKLGQTGGGTPKDSGNLRERHFTKIDGSRLEGRFGVDPSRVKYAGYVHGGTFKMEKRPWLDYAQQRAKNRVQLHYEAFMDQVLAHIAT